MKKTIKKNTSPKPQWFFVGGITLFIALFFWQYLLSGNRIFSGDFDYYSQLYEAFRISLLKFHQIPFWNPWMSGGIPLLANPQLGPISIQAVLTLALGTVYGLKIAYILYAMAGFWGMYLLCRRALKADQIRSTLIGLLWICNGFFAGHSIAHFTFAAFFLFPWLFLILSQWRSKWSWFYLALFEIIVLFGSVHYPFLLMNFAMLIFVGTIAGVHLILGQASLDDAKQGLLFFAKAVGLTLLVAGYRLYFILSYTKGNPRPDALFNESTPSPEVILSALYLPVGTILKVPTTIQWSWGEYSAYLGLGVTAALLVIGITSCVFLFRIRRKVLRSLPTLHIGMGVGFLGLALVGLSLAFGDHGSFSPYHILRELPGFSETRVSSRWLLTVLFSSLGLLALWRPQKNVINILLALAVIELFVFFGPIKTRGTSAVALPPAQFSPAYQTYDNHLLHQNFALDPEQSYFHTTRQNLGQIYSDDSIINTLNKVLGTNRCGQNVSPDCTLVLSKNANVEYWSPNKIILKRTDVGVVSLNMNVDSGWRINDEYIFAGQRPVNPELLFNIPDDNAPTYILEYAPRFTPHWFTWRMHR